MNEKLRVGIIGATGYVGQRFITLLDGHPWFVTSKLAASPRSAGKVYSEAIEGRWKLDLSIPVAVKDMLVYSSEDIEAFCEDIDFVLCAVDMKKEEIRAFEERIARLEVPVVSNNSAHRMTADVPMVIPEINPEHLDIIDAQKKRLGTKHGFIAVKPNCSIQSYVPAIDALREFEPNKISVCTYQAISGAGKNFSDWPEMIENLIPFIGGEEEKSENEPLKVWGNVAGDKIEHAQSPVISAQCYRVAVQEGHTAAVSVSFKKDVNRDQIISAWANYKSKIADLELPSAPVPFIQYLDDDNRPQPKLDVMAGNGMAVSIGRLRADSIFDFKFACLSHNTLRGASGGAVLTAELLAKKGYIVRRQSN